MSTCKSSKAELIAIYRLEFYKKQGNWKLSSSRREKRSSKKQDQTTHRLELDTTYTVDTPCKETSDLHNVAFIDSASELKLETGELSQEWQEPVNIWPNELPETQQHTTQDCGDGPKLTTTQRLQRLLEAAKKCGYYDHYTHNEYNATQTHAQDSTSTIFNEGTNYVQLSNQHQSGCYDSVQVETGEMCSEMDVAAAMGNSEPDGYLLGDAEPAANMEHNLSVDSEGEFMRGADVAPHSSETDLTTAPLMAPDLSSMYLSRLSSQQVQQALKYHRLAIRKLAHEIEERQKIRNNANLTSDLSNFEECPTHDVGLSPPLVRDPFVAGSHMPRKKLPPLAWDLLT